MNEQDFESHYLSKMNSGKVKKAGKVIVYGVEGSGKSTLASKAPRPLIIDFENGTNHIECNRINLSNVLEVEGGDSLIGLLSSIVNTIKKKGRHVFKFDTIIIDPIDKMEDILILECIKLSNSVSLYAGFDKSAFAKLVNYETIIQGLLDELISLYVNVMIVAHSEAKKITEPGMEPVDKYNLKLEKKSASMWSEWCNDLCFIKFNEKIVQVADGRTTTNKLVGGKDRIMYTERSLGFSAKHRSSLKGEINISKEEDVADFFKSVFLSYDDLKIEFKEFVNKLGDPCEVLDFMVKCKLATENSKLDLLDKEIYLRILAKKDAFILKYNETKNK